MKQNDGVLALRAGVSWECFMAIRQMNFFCGMDADGADCRLAQAEVWYTCP